MLADQLGRTSDAGQAGTLAWGIGNMKGLTDDGRTRTVAVLLGQLAQQGHADIRNIISRSIAQLAASGGPGAFDSVRELVDRARAGEPDPARQDQLRRLLETLDAGRRSRG